MDALFCSTPCRDEGALREALSERDVLARELIELDQQIVGRNAGAGVAVGPGAGGIVLAMRSRLRRAAKFTFLVHSHMLRKREAEED
jgi:hypothetical protein